MEDKYQKALKHITQHVHLEYFEKYILQSAKNKHDLFLHIREVNSEGLPRFNVWRLLLQIVPIDGDWDAKRQSIEASRKRYLNLKEQALTGIKPTAVKQVAVPKNPLMKGMVKTQKKEGESDNFLREEIKKDVDRTYQQLQFFQDPNVLKLLSNVLFVWCKNYPQISYKQGMNELLASVVHVYFHQTVVIKDSSELSEIQKKFLFLNTIEHAEPDIYAVFDKIMIIQKEMYKEELGGSSKGFINPNSKNNSPILQRIIQIQDHKLKALDLELFRIIKLQDVKTKTFLLRWIRCLHTRQFGLQNSLYIWDSIFLDYYESPNSKSKYEYQFVDAFCIAMFIYMRSYVLTRETANEILQIYQKYPPLSKGQYLQQLIKLSWQVCEALRNLNQNQNQSKNWYQEAGKTKNLGLMERGGYSQTMKKQQIEEKKQKRHQQEVQIAKEVQKIQEDSNSLFNQKPALKSQSINANDLFAKKKQQVKPIIQKEQPASKVEKKIIFDFSEIKEAIQTLKQSISLNDDIQSRALANKALKILETKFND